MVGRFGVKGGNLEGQMVDFIKGKKMAVVNNVN